ncbi:MAG: hypothetical protein K2I27_07080 [Bacteroides sp.]|nr:hypothetical protein [Bacteroides sp.]
MNNENQSSVLMCLYSVWIREIYGSSGIWSDNRAFSPLMIESVIVRCHSKYRMSPIYIISDNAQYYHNKDLWEWAEETNFFLTIKEAWSKRAPSIY